MCKSSKIMITVLLVATTLWTAACGPSASPSEPSGGDGSAPLAGTSKVAAVEVAKQRGGKLNMVPGGVVFGNPNDPHLVVTGAGRVYSMPVTNYLLMRDLYDEKFPIVGDLAKSWEVSKDGLSYTFKLQQGVKFHNVPPVNGREFTSEDAKYTFLRITADPSVIVEKWRPRFQRVLDFGGIKSIDTPDKYTVTVNLKEPFAPFLDSVAHPGTQILPREFIEKFPDKIIIEGMIGTGPFMPVEYKNQVIATFKRNPDYWKKDSQGNQLPYLDELHYLYFADVQSQLAAFRSGQLDVATPGATRSNLDPIKRDLPKTQVYLTPSANIMNFRFNMKFKPFQDVRVRKAISLAIDRHQFLELIVEGIGVVSGPLTPTFPDLANTMDWLLSQPGYRKDKTQDLAEAKRLMKDAGYESGLTFELMQSGTTGDIPSLLQEQLKPLNITLKTDLVDYAGQWVPRSAQGEFELSNMTHVMSTDGDSLLAPHLYSAGGRNYGKFNDPVLDGLIDKQRAAVTQEERRKLAQEAEMRILDQVPMIFTYNPYYLLLAQPYVHNAGDGPVAGSGGYMVERAWVEKH